eukprot:7002172-Prymnesium_polylepis.2
MPRATRAVRSCTLAACGGRRGLRRTPPRPDSLQCTSRPAARDTPDRGPKAQRRIRGAPHRRGGGHGDDAVRQGHRQRAAAQRRALGLSRAGRRGLQAGATLRSAGGVPAAA